jgi:hypothetical protein
MKRILPFVAFVSVLFMAVPAQAVERDTFSFRGTGVQWFGSGHADCGGGNTAYLFLSIQALDGHSTDSLHVDFFVDDTECGGLGFGGGNTFSLPKTDFFVSNDYSYATLADQTLILPDFEDGPAHTMVLDNGMRWDGGGTFGRYRDSGSDSGPGFRFTFRSTFYGYPEAALTSGDVYVDGVQYIQPVDEEGGRIGKFSESSTSFCQTTCF